MGKWRNRAAALQDDLDRSWLQWIIIAWLLIAAWIVFQRWPYIRWFALGDTDDNMRFMQVRGLLHGQGWYDLTQYRLNPPSGFNIHWSRLVDLPIAGLILFFRMFTSDVWAQRLAVGIAPLLPLSVVFGAIGFTVRRLIAPLAYPLAILLLSVGCSVAMLMFMPERIDHDGWQLAFLCLMIAGLVDTDRIRAGALIGLSSAASLSVGLEMLPYLALAGAILTLRWIWERDQATTIRVYALSLSGGTAAGFAAFTSYANMAMRCDALTPVYLTMMLAAGVLLFLLSLWSPGDRKLRAGGAIVAGIALAALYAIAFPQCLGRPEGISPELQHLWLDNVREAKPIYHQPLRTSLPMAVMPLIGLVGSFVALWLDWRRDRSLKWLPSVLFTVPGCAFLLWQVRFTPSAQLLAVPGATALAWIVLPWFLRQKSMLARVAGTVAAFIAISGLFTGLLLRWFPIDPPSPRVKTIDRANSRCASLPWLEQLNRIPAQIVFTHVDLGPRLIATTHHDAIAGPYHRNGQSILDVHHAFMGSPQRFLAIAARHHATLLLTCPNMSETTVYRARSPDGFYGQLAQGRTFGFLKPVALPTGSPFKAWEIEYPGR